MPDSTLASQGKEQALELTKAFAQEQPNVNATYLYNSGQVVLRNDIEHLVILILNEGYHGPGEEDESRFISQLLSPLSSFRKSSDIIE